MKHINDISLMLPDYIANRLSAADRKTVENAVNNNPDLEAELEFQKNISKALQTEEGINPPGELGWARLSREINAEPKIVEHPAAANDAAPSRPFWRYAAAILAVAVIGQSVFIGSKLTPSEDDRFYPVLEVSETITVKVSFESTAPHSDITALIKTVKGNVISGPSNQGLYSIAFDTNEQREAAEKIFAERKDLVQTQGRP